MPIDTGTPSNKANTQNAGRRDRSTSGGGLGTNNVNSAPGAAPFAFQTVMALPIMAKNGSKHLNDFLKTFGELERDETTWKVGTVVLDNTKEVGWRFSTVAVTVHSTHNPDVMAVYPVQLEHTISRPQEDVTVKNGDLEFRLPAVPSMAMDNDWREAIIDLVTSKYPNVSADAITLVQGMSVPKNLDLTDIEVVGNIVANAVGACVTLLVETINGFGDVNLTQLDPNVIPTVRLETTTFSDRTDLLGRPVREDFRMTFSGRSVETAQQSRDPFRQNDAAAQETAWGDLALFMEPMYSPQPTSMLSSTEPRTRVLAIRAVITDMRQYRMSSAASNLMMLLPTMCLADRNIWMSLMYQRMKDFYNKYPDAEPNPTDLGMLNYITRAFGGSNPSDPVAPAALVDSTNDPSAFIDFMNASFKEDIYVAIDVPAAGANSWFLSLFTSMANGDVDAMHEFCRAADVLTGGLFTQNYFGGDTSNLKVSDFFAETNSTLYAGQYTARTPDGEVQMVDERTIDYTALQAKLGRTNPAVMQKWSQSWLVKDVPDAAHRLSMRDEVESAYAGKLEHYDFFERHTFMSEMLSALWNSAVQAGLQPELRYIDALRGASSGLSAPAFTTYKGLESGGLNQSFQRTGGLQSATRRNTGFGAGRNSGNRWGRN